MVSYWEKVLEKYDYDYDKTIYNYIWAHHFKVNLQCLLCGRLNGLVGRWRRRKQPFRCEKCGELMEY